ncbi:putative PX domain protein [Toxoplasma gondii FOU]|uniref:Putative PX domain protein n=2 Tax=Toxoplasma gondii TaxID=5811 RepID=A0A086L7Q5_TOXGO|nr:putative PX domain protein [Toxoplasma gondii FOU]
MTGLYTSPLGEDVAVEGPRTPETYDCLSTDSTTEEGDVSPASQPIHDEAPIPFSVAIPRAEVVNTGAWLTHVSYLVQFSDMGVIRTVRRRFRDFERLAQDLDRLLSHPRAHVLCATNPRPPPCSREPQTPSAEPQGPNGARCAGGDRSGPWGMRGATAPGFSLEDPVGRGGNDWPKGVRLGDNRPHSRSPERHCHRDRLEGGEAGVSVPASNGEDEARDTHRSFPPFPFVVSVGGQSVRFPAVEEENDSTPSVEESPANPFLASPSASGQRAPWLGRGDACAYACRGACATKESLVSALPAKRLFGNMDPAFVEERRRELERFLHLLLLREEVFLLPPFWAFFEASEAAALLARFFLLTTPARRRSGSYDAAALRVMQETLWGIRELAAGLREEGNRHGRDGGMDPQPTQAQWLSADPGDRGASFDFSALRLCLSSPEGHQLRCPAGEKATRLPETLKSWRASADPSSAAIANPAGVEARRCGQRDSEEPRNRVEPPTGRSEAELWRLGHPQFVLRLLCMIADGPFLPACVQLQVVDLLCLLLSVSPSCLLRPLVQAHAFELVFRLLEYTAASVNAELCRDLSRLNLPRMRSSQPSAFPRIPGTREAPNLRTAYSPQSGDACASGVCSSSDEAEETWRGGREPREDIHGVSCTQEGRLREAERRDRGLVRKIKRQALSASTTGSPGDDQEANSQDVACKAHVRVLVEVADACMRLCARLIELCPNEFLVFLKSKEGLLRIRDLLRMQHTRKSLSVHSPHEAKSKDIGPRGDRRRDRGSAERRRPSQSGSRGPREKAGAHGRGSGRGWGEEGDTWLDRDSEESVRKQRQRQSEAAVGRADEKKSHSRQTPDMSENESDEPDTDATEDSANESETSSNSSFESFLSEEEGTSSSLLSALHRRAMRRMLLCMLPLSGVPGDRTLEVAGACARVFEMRKRRGRRRVFRGSVLSSSASSVSSDSADLSEEAAFSGAARRRWHRRRRGEEKNEERGLCVSRASQSPLRHRNMPRLHARGSCTPDRQGSAGSHGSAFSSVSHSVASGQSSSEACLPLPGASGEFPKGDGGGARGDSGEGALQGESSIRESDVLPRRQAACAALAIPNEALRRAFKGRLHCFVALLLWIALPLVGVGRALTSPQSLGLETLSLLYKCRHDTASRVLCALLLSALLRSTSSSFFAEDGRRRARLRQFLSHSLSKKSAFPSLGLSGRSEAPREASHAQATTHREAANGDEGREDVHARARQAAEAIGTLPLHLVMRALKQPDAAELPSCGLSRDLLFYLLSPHVVPRLIPLLSLSSFPSHRGTPSLLSPPLSPSSKGERASPAPPSVLSPSCSGARQEETCEVRAACEMEICFFVCWLLGLLVSRASPLFACLRREADREGGGEDGSHGRDVGACKAAERPSFLICQLPASASASPSAFTNATSSHIPSSVRQTFATLPLATDGVCERDPLSPGDSCAAAASPGEVSRIPEASPDLPHTDLGLPLFPDPTGVRDASEARPVGGDRESQKSSSFSSCGGARRLRCLSSQPLLGRGGLPFLSSLVPALLPPACPSVSAFPSAGASRRTAPVAEDSLPLGSLPESYLATLLSFRRLLPPLFGLLQQSPSVPLQRLAAFVLLWLPGWQAQVFPREAAGPRRPLSSETGDSCGVGLEPSPGCAETPAGCERDGRDPRVTGRLPNLEDRQAHAVEESGRQRREEGNHEEKREPWSGERAATERVNGDGEGREGRQRPSEAEASRMSVGDTWGDHEWARRDEKKAGQLQEHRATSRSTRERNRDPGEMPVAIPGTDSSSLFSSPPCSSSSSQVRLETHSERVEQNAEASFSRIAFSSFDIALLQGRMTGCLLLLQQVQEEGDSQKQRLEAEKKKFQFLEKLVACRRSSLRIWRPSGPRWASRRPPASFEASGAEGRRRSAEKTPSEDWGDEEPAHAQSCDSPLALHLSSASLDSSSSCSHLPPGSPSLRPGRDEPADATDQEATDESEERRRRRNRGERPVERRGEDDIWTFLKQLGRLRRTRREMKRQTNHAVAFLTNTRGKLESVHLYASSVEHLCTTKVLPLSAALPALDATHRRLSSSLAEKERKEDEAMHAAQKQNEQEVAAHQVLQACTEQSAAAKREAMRTRNKWMEVEHLIAAAPQRRQQLEEQVEYRMQILTRIREQCAEAKLRLDQLRGDIQRRSQQRTQDEAEVQQLAAALEAYTAALNSRQKSAAASPELDLSSQQQTAVPADLSEENNWPLLTPFVRLLPSRVQATPEILRLVSASEPDTNAAPPPPSSSASSGWPASRGEVCLRFLRLLESLLATRRDALGEGEDEEEARYHEAMVLEDQVESATREVEMHERQLEQLRVSISEQTNRTSLLKKADALQTDVRK